MGVTQSAKVRGVGVKKELERVNDETTGIHAVNTNHIDGTRAAVALEYAEVQNTQSDVVTDYLRRALWPCA